MHASKDSQMDASMHTPGTTTRLIWFAFLVLVPATFLAGCRGRSEKTPQAASPANSAAAARQPAKPINSKNPVVRIDTSSGPITLTLNGIESPGTVSNFVNYATEGFYDNTIIHYVAPGQMIVAGGYTSDRQPKPARTPIRNEAHNGLKNVRGTIAMARDPSHIDSATSQFFINLADAPQRDHLGDAPNQYGYCVFGQVTDGLDTADKISQAPTTNLSGDLAQTPDPPVIIKSIRVIQ
jgi:cyclophilin family peptidyl-prolyl cis-trans isomerase